MVDREAGSLEIIQTDRVFTKQIEDNWYDMEGVADVIAC
jgi:hypothetical protein